MELEEIFRHGILNKDNENIYLKPDLVEELKKHNIPHVVVNPLCLVVKRSLLPDFLTAEFIASLNLDKSFESRITAEPEEPAVFDFLDSVQWKKHGICIVYDNEEYVFIDPRCESILKKYNIPYTVKDALIGGNDRLAVKKINFVDFLESEQAKLHVFDFLRSKYITNVPVCRFIKTCEGAVTPTKKRSSDEGYDITLIGVEREISPAITRYRTGIRVETPYGYHVEMVPRSSLSSSGYMLANSVGIIDAGYTGELLVTLIKVDPSAKPIELPFKCMQSLLRESIHYYMKEVSNFDGETMRGDGGFGSTGQ